MDYTATRTDDGAVVVITDGLSIGTLTYRGTDKPVIVSVENTQDSEQYFKQMDRCHRLAQLLDSNLEGGDFMDDVIYGLQHDDQVRQRVLEKLG